jgi:hypothetical protein
MSVKCVLALACMAVLGSPAQQAQTGGAKPEPGRVIGEVAAVDAPGSRLTVKTDAGSPVTVLLDERTQYLRVPPGEKDLKKAARISLGDIGSGDRVLARGPFSEDQKSLTASAVIVMTKDDLARKQEAERTEWQRRGIAGRITSLDPAKQELTVTVGSRDAVRSVVIGLKEHAAFRRYAPDSVRFADAKPSSFAELNAGDYVRALGDAGQDGARFDAEQVVSGSFRNVAGVVKSVDAASGEIRIGDLETKKILTVQIRADSVLRRMPPMVAAMMARRRDAGPAGGMTRSMQPAGSSAGAARPPADFQQMIERMPQLAVAELKAGDAIVVSSTNGADPSRLTAITLVAGVEPLLSSDPLGGQQIGGAWNFDIGLP